jgi:phosphoheptose isomerase
MRRQQRGRARRDDAARQLRRVVTRFRRRIRLLVTDETPPKLDGKYLVVYMVGRLDEMRAEQAAMHTKLDEHIKGAVGFRWSTMRAMRRSDFINIAVAVAHGVWVSAATLGGVLAGSYVIVFHNWYVQRLLAWWHGLF